MNEQAVHPGPDPLLGRVIGGKYRLEQKLGAGAMGIVYRAIDAAGAACAVKVMTQEAARDRDLRERFEREAVALLELKHPHILEVRDYGFDPQVQLPFLVMELLEGRTLEDMVVDTPPDPETGLQIAKQILRGLAHAHAQGVLHRDLKTENVFVTWNGSAWVAKLLDFGLVKFEDQSKWGTERKLTLQGMVFGSPAYMSPEQGVGGKVDARSDVYSAGVVLYELLTGSWPFEPETPQLMLSAHIAEPVPPLASKREGLVVRPELEAIVQKALAKRPIDRYAHAGEMLAALEAVPSPGAWIRGMTNVPPQPIAPAPAAAAATGARSTPPAKESVRLVRLVVALGVGTALVLVVGSVGLLLFFMR